jgi:hypothetical protein
MKIVNGTRSHVKAAPFRGYGFTAMSQRFRFNVPFLTTVCVRVFRLSSMIA